MRTTKTKTRICPECGVEFTPPVTRGQQRIFCSDAHKMAHSNRRTVRGKSLAAIAQGWRQTRGAGDFGKFLFGEMTAMIDHWNAEDLAAGRLRADEYAKLVTNYRETKPTVYNGNATYDADRWFDRQAR